MKPNAPLPNWLLDRRLFLGMGLVSLAGCAKRLTRGQTPEAVDLDGEKKDGPDLVGDNTRPWGLNHVKLEAVALAKNLNDTGSDPPPSPLRQQLITEMQSHEIRNPDAILASPTTSMVVLKAFLPPGVRKGDVLDVDVSCPSGSQTTSLKGGWVMQARMRQVEVLGGELRSGSIDGLAEGDVLVDAIFDGTQDKVNSLRGRILAGCTSRITRDLGLAIRKENATARLSSVIANAINLRFSIFERGVKQGVATAKRDNYLDLTVPPIYRNNLSHYLRVVRNIPLRETPVQRIERMQILEKKLQEPATCAAAAIQLEAIGKEAVETLHKGLESRDPECRFYAAQALAYLDDPKAPEVLRKIAENEASFRWYALTALSSMNHVSAYNALSEMLSSQSAESRYGAFRSIRTRSPDDPSTKGQIINRAFYYHVISSTAEPMIHFTRRRRPEVVLFNSEQPLNLTDAIMAGQGFVIKPVSTEQIRVSRFSPGIPDQQDHCEPNVDAMIRAMAKMGAGYTDVIETINEAKKLGALKAKIVVEAWPLPGRQFFKDEESQADQPPAENAEEATETVAANVGNPAPAGLNP